MHHRQAREVAPITRAASGFASGVAPSFAQRALAILRVEIAKAAGST